MARGSQDVAAGGETFSLSPEDELPQADATHTPTTRTPVVQTRSAMELGTSDDSRMIIDGR